MSMGKDAFLAAHPVLECAWSDCLETHVAGWFVFPDGARLQFCSEVHADRWLAERKRVVAWVAAPETAST